MAIKKDRGALVIQLLFGLLSFAGVVITVQATIITLVLVTLSFLISFFSFLIYTKKSLFIGAALNYGILLIGTLAGYLQLSSLRGSGFGGLGIAVAIIFGLGIAWFVHILAIPIWLIYIDKARGAVRSVKWYKGLILVLYTLGFGLVCRALIQNFLIDRVTSFGYKIDAAFLTSTFPVMFGFTAWLISAAVGFYIARLLGHLIHDSVPRVSRKLTLGVFVLILIVIGVPLIFEASFRKVETQEIETITQEFTLSDFEEEAITGENQEDFKLEISATIFTPTVKDYWIEAALVDLLKTRNRGDVVLGFEYESLLPTHEIFITTSGQTVGKYGNKTVGLTRGEQSIVFSMAFGGFFEERVDERWVNLLREAVEKNSLGIEVLVSTSSYGMQRGDPILQTTHGISRQSLQELGVLDSLDIE